MKKKSFALLLIVLFLCSSVFAKDWYVDKVLTKYESIGLINVDENLIHSVMRKYLGHEFNNSVFQDIQKDISKISGINYITASVSSLENDTLKLSLTFYEFPMISRVTFEGNNTIRNYDILSQLNTVAVGKFVDPSKKVFESTAITEVQNVYLDKGFDTVPITMNYNIDPETNLLELHFHITEGTQTKVSAILFEGNKNVLESTLKKGMNQKSKSLFYNGFLKKENIRLDEAVILNNYANQGYIDAKVVDVRIEQIDSKNEKFDEVNIVYVVDEGEQWLFGEMDISGNTVYSTEELQSLIKIPEKTVINMAEINDILTKISDKYYDNGYIASRLNLEDERVETEKTVKFHVTVTEGEQCHVEKVVISGLTKTQEYVMQREVTLKEGNVFSKADLITSAQNIYNTGLITTIDYNIDLGTEENGIVIEFIVEEGNQMDIQFGATFGGNVEGFPVSGFLSWSNHNLFGRAKDASISTNVSPDSQSLSFSIGDNWFRGKRWANSISLSFTHNKYTGELQKSGGAAVSDYYDGRNSDKVFPLGYLSYESWKKSNGEYPSSNYLMDYRLLTFGLGYNSGYTFIWNPGRLSLNGGLSLSINKALYDGSKYDPFEKLTKKYHEKWQFSNKLNFGIQWDGRDFINNPTKGYLLSTSYTYAGGVLQGLSNYQKISTSAAGYFKILSFGERLKQRNLMFCASSSLSLMLPQYYSNEEDTEKEKLAFHDPHLGATKYEMLYIDGMTIARGHDFIHDQVFLWDNTAEISYPLVQNVLNAEVFASATAVVENYKDFKTGLNWYFATGFGVKVKVSGFPIGFYIVKDAIYENSGSFNWCKGSIFNKNGNNNSGLKFVLAISTSLI